MLKLIKLTKEYKDQLSEMIEEWKKDQEENNTNRSPWAIFKNDYHNIDFYISDMYSKTVKEGFVLATTYFLLDDESNRLLGAINIRHYLNDVLKNGGGHIGDGIRPSERKKGYATKMISLALEKCHELGIKDVMMSCSKDNIGSKKSIINNGGVFDCEFIEDDEICERYWIHLNDKLDIKVYENGEAFISENKEYLLTNPNLSTFFFYDAPLLVNKDSKNYALKLEVNDKKLLALNVVPYHLMMFGDKELVPYLINYLLSNNLEFDSYLCEKELGDEFIKSIELIRGFSYEEALAMDFMECHKVNGKWSDDVKVATLDDLDGVYECQLGFVHDCNLNDAVIKENIAQVIDTYRVIKEDNEVIAICRIANGVNNAKRISCVYTRPDKRGQNLARKLVTNATIEILNAKELATLNVDVYNPITNHLYRSIGYERIFSQGEYRRK